MPRTRRAPAPEPVILYDVRERLPWRFAGARQVFLKTADYTVEGLESVIAIERKSPADLFSTIGAGRRRFKAELDRMKAIKHAYVIIEASLPAIMAEPPTYSRLHPHSMIGSICSWSLKYGVHFIFAGDRRHAAALCKKLLTMAWANHLEELSHEPKRADATGGTGICEDGMGGLPVQG